MTKRKPLARLPASIVLRCPDDWLFGNSKRLMDAFSGWFDHDRLNRLVLAFGNEKAGWSDNDRRRIHMSLAIAVCPELRAAVRDAAAKRSVVQRTAADAQLEHAVEIALYNDDALNASRRDMLCLALCGTTDLRFASRQELLDLKAVLR